MRHKNDCLPTLFPYVKQLLLHGLSGLCIYRSKRLIHQQYFGVSGQSSRDTDSLLHASGKLKGIVIFKSCETNQIDIFLTNASLLIFRDFFGLKAKFNVASCGSPRKETKLLKYHGTVKTRPFNDCSIYNDRARFRLHKPIQYP